MLDIFRYLKNLGGGIILILFAIIYMSPPRFELGTPAFLSEMLRKNISNETFSYKSSALT